MSVADIYVVPRRSLVKLFCVIDLKKWISQDRKIGKKKKLRTRLIFCGKLNAFGVKSEPAEKSMRDRN